MLSGILIAIIVCIFLYYNTQRGKKFLQSYIYLEHYHHHIELGRTKEEAILAANSVVKLYNNPLRDTFDKYSDGSATIWLIRAKKYSRTYYNGRQLPVIAEARRLGFFG